MQDNKTRSIIFKSGDNLALDKGVLSFVEICERLISKYLGEPFFRIKKYNVLPVSTYPYLEGIIEHIESESLAEILERDNGSLIPFFLKKLSDSFLNDDNSDNDNETDIEKKIDNLLPFMRNYLDSCAFYCVITFILGVGDRHLDNILLSTDGKYIFYISTC